MSDLRDDIEREDDKMAETPTYAQLQESTDSIIALFREAMLSDEAIEAVHRKTAMCKLTQRDARESITAALGAALGEQS